MSFGKIAKRLLKATDEANIMYAVLRVFIGFGMATHGYSKLFENLGDFSKFVGTLGFPVPVVFGFLAAFSEFFGAIMLAAGFLTRINAFMICFTMCVAAFMAHTGFSEGELALLYLFASLLFVAKGSGKYSVDRLLFK